jgi:NAD(P)-dependent dehydrogenase (short-subunit alcohol dehydrogenase family)
MKDTFSLEGKNIIVTGASSGIGRQCAISCSKMGATVILMGRDNERLKQTVESMTNKENHLLFSIDLCEYEKVEQILDNAVSMKGKIDGLINAAGIASTLPFKMVTPRKMDEYFRTNVIAGINLSRLVTNAKVVSEKGASIVFISSVMGMVGEKGKSLYGMTKGALIAASKSLALEFAAKKIRVNTISPGVVVTPMTGNDFYSQDEELLNLVKSYHPLGLGEPSDVAGACIFLLSDASRWITGTNLVIDGGYTAH